MFLEIRNASGLMVLTYKQIIKLRDYLNRAIKEIEARMKNDKKIHEYRKQIKT